MSTTVFGVCRGWQIQHFHNVNNNLRGVPRLASPTFSQCHQRSLWCAEAYASNAFTMPTTARRGAATYTSNIFTMSTSVFAVCRDLHGQHVHNVNANHGVCRDVHVQHSQNVNDNLGVCRDLQVHHFHNVNGGLWGVPTLASPTDSQRQQRSLGRADTCKPNMFTMSTTV